MEIITMGYRNFAMRFLILMFGTGFVWDTFTTIYGTWQQLGGDAADMLVGVVAAVVVNGYLYGSSWIIPLFQGNFLKIFVMCLWCIALAGDFFTSYLGNIEFLWPDAEIFVLQNTQDFILLGITILVTSSPIILSQIIHEEGIKKKAAMEEWNKKYMNGKI